MQEPQQTKGVTIDNLSTTAEPPSAEANGGLYQLYWPNLCPRFFCCKNTKCLARVHAS